MKLRILIIDDEMDYCMIMKNYFQSRNYQVFIGTTIRECWKNLEENQPDILLLDNNLTDGKGWEQVDDIVKKYPSLKLYLISAYHQKKDFRIVHENVTIWEKPISLDLLNKALG
jgi:DNA-binding NtrC family response regulator